MTPKIGKWDCFKFITASAQFFAEYLGIIRNKGGLRLSKAVKFSLVGCKVCSRQSKKKRFVKLMI